ncbi:hypothetical protein AB0A73_24705 [Glycomyces sp. NPDC047369]
MVDWKVWNWFQGHDSSDAGRPMLHTLAPRNDPALHGTYVDALRAALDGKVDARNIALAGPYGVGKSSIIKAIVAQYSKPRKPVAELSLSTLGTTSEAADGGSIRIETNLIQREIVRQLLYLLPPSRMRLSRFKRIARPQLWRVLFAAVALGVAAVLAMVLTGWGRAASGNLSAFGFSAPSWSGYAVAFTLVAGTWLGIRYGWRQSIVLDKFAAGPATLSLTSAQDTYFDEYTDEIVHFFEVSRCTIVIFEDLDRFGNTEIFEDLRALNTFLNQAGQLRGRKIRFVYAVSDSLFEAAAPADADHLSKSLVELERANRTKFFELIVPVVPFITRENARDLLKKKLQTGSGIVSDALVSLIAPHVADMRLIINLCNEFEIYWRQLIDQPTRFPDLTDDKMFALVAYKSIYMSDFEDIRHGRSRLDALYRHWRAMVPSCLDARAAERIEILERLDSANAWRERAGELGARLCQQAELLSAGLTNVGGQHYQVRVGSLPVDQTHMMSPEFWSDLAEKRSTLEINLAPNYSNMTIEIPADSMDTFLGLDLDPVRWANEDQTAHTRRLEALAAESKFLRHHTWEELWVRSDITFSADGRMETFREAAERILQSKMTVDLIAGGYIDQYFMLYVSAFYEEHLSKDAMQFLLRNIDRGQPDERYPLSRNDVDAIINREGDSILREPTMLNLSVLDSLLAPDTKTDVQPIIDQLLPFSSKSQPFINHYLAEGAFSETLVERMTPFWDSVFTHLAGAAPIDDEQRHILFDQALRSANRDTDYEFDNMVASYIETDYQAFTVLTESAPADEVAAAIAIISLSGAELLDVSNLTPLARDAISETGTYMLTASNLALLSGSANVALDRLRTAKNSVYRRALEDLPSYLDAVISSDATSFTIEGPDAFANVLNETPDESPFEKLVHGSAPDCRVNDLRQVPARTWPALAKAGRMPATFANLGLYLEEYSELDEPLANLLRTTPITDIPNDELDARYDLAIAILNAGENLPDPILRVELSEQLDLDTTLAITDLRPESGGLIAELLRVGLLEDSATSFAGTHLPDWTTREAAIAASEQFEEFMSPELIPASQVGSLFSSSAIPDKVKLHILADLVSYTHGADPESFATIGSIASKNGWQLQFEQIDILVTGGLHKPHTVVRLINFSGSLLQISQVHQLLNKLGGEYTKLTAIGPRPIQLSNRPWHRALLTRLKAEGNVSTFSETRDHKLRVNLRRK